MLRSSLGIISPFNYLSSLALDTAMEQPEGQIYIIPVRLEECDAPESLHRYHRVELFEDNGYERLMQALELRRVQGLGDVEVLACPNVLIHFLW